MPIGLDFQSAWAFRNLCLWITAAAEITVSDVSGLIDSILIGQVTVRPTVNGLNLSGRNRRLSSLPRWTALHNTGEFTSSVISTALGIARFISIPSAFHYTVLATWSLVRGGAVHARIACCRCPPYFRLVSGLVALDPVLSDCGGAWRINEAIYR